MLCSRCGQENKEGAKFCNECGSKLEVTCAACSTANPPGSKYCSECGSPLGREADRQRGGQEDKATQVGPLSAGRGSTKPVLSKGEGLTTGGAPEAERRQFCLLYTSDAADE